MTTEPATRPPSADTDVLPPQGTAPAPGRRHPGHRWTRWRPRYPWSGTTGALLLGCASLTPSLLPRGWVLQGLIAGITAAIGYGLGVTVAWFLAEATEGRVPTGVRRRAWQVLAVVGPLLCLAALWLGAGWQREVHELMGLDPPEGWSSIGVVVVAVAVLVGLVAVGRGIRVLA